MGSSSLLLLLLAPLQVQCSVVGPIAYYPVYSLFVQTMEIAVQHLQVNSHIDCNEFIRANIERIETHYDAIEAEYNKFRLDWNIANQQRMEEIEGYLNKLDLIYHRLQQAIPSHADKKILRGRSVHFDAHSLRQTSKPRDGSGSRSRSRSRVRQQLQSSNYSCPICPVFGDAKWKRFDIPSFDSLI